MQLRITWSYIFYLFIKRLKFRFSFGHCFRYSLNPDSINAILLNLKLKKHNIKLKFIFVQPTHNFTLYKDITHAMNLREKYTFFESNLKKYYISLTYKYTYMWNFILKSLVLHHIKTLYYKIITSWTINHTNISWIYVLIFFKLFRNLTMFYHIIAIFR